MQKITTSLRTGHQLTSPIFWITLFTFLILSQGLCVAATKAMQDAQEPLFTVRGIGGGGGFFSPTFSPYDKNLLFTVCDMGGIYRSENGGKSWQMLNWNTSPREAFFAPNPLFLTESRMAWFRNIYTLVLSEDKGRTWTDYDRGPWYEAYRKTPAKISNARENRMKKYINSFLFLDAKEPNFLVSSGYGLWKGNKGAWERLSDKPCSHLQRINEDIFYLEDNLYMVKSSDNGQSWKKIPLPDKSKSLGGAATADGSNIFYINIVGKGIFSSKNEGETWELSTDDFDHILEFIIPKGQSDIVFARQGYPATPTNLFRTTDGGKTWDPTFRMHDKQTTFWLDVNVEQSWLQRHLFWSYYFTDISSSPLDPQVLMASTQGELFISRDSGDTWQTFFSENFPPLEGDIVPRHKSIGLEVTSVWGYHFDPHDPQREYIAYTDVGFARSMDKGSTWAWAGTGSPWSNTFYDIAFDPDTPGKMFAAASNLHDLPHFLQVSAIHPKAVVHQGGALISTNYGQNWKVPYSKDSMSGGLPAQVCTSIVIDPKSPKGNRTLFAAIFGEADDAAGVYVSKDEGKTWAKTPAQPGGHNKHIYKIRFHPLTGDLYALITGLRASKEHYFNKDEGGIWRSSDRGKSWQHISKGSPLSHWATSMTFHPTEPKGIYVTAASPQGISAGGVYYTKDGGKRWWNILPDKDIKRLTSRKRDYDHWMSSVVHPKKTNIIFAGSTNNGLFFSVDGGRRWKWCPEFPFSNVQSMTFNPRNPDELILTTFGSGVWSTSLKELLRRYDINYDKI